MKKIIGISLCFLTLLASCTNLKNKDYIDYKEYELSSLDLFYTLNLSEYSIYLMNDECIDCERIKKDVFKYYDTKDNPTMFFYNMKSYGTKEGNENRNKFAPKNEYSDIYNINTMLEKEVNTLKDTYFCCTPSIYMIKNNYLYNFLYQEKDILNYINQ